MLVRRAFFDAAETKRASGEDCAVFVIDIDHFKRVNDRFGHATGDSVIIAFANHLRSISQNGILSARFGGEEFVVLLPATSPEKAKAFGETIVHDTAKLCVEGPAGDIRFTVSAGLCMLPQEAAMDSALGRADDALYLAKSHGRDQLALAPTIEASPTANRSSPNLRNTPRVADPADALNGRRMSCGT